VYKRKSDVITCVAICRVKVYDACLKISIGKNTFRKEQIYGVLVRKKETRKSFFSPFSSRRAKWGR